MSRLRDLLIKRRSEVTLFPEVYYDIEKQGTTNQDAIKDKLIDFSGNGNHGQLNNFAFNGSDGWKDKYLQFDATKRTNVTIPNLKGFKTVFLDVDKGEEIDTLLYDQRIAWVAIGLAIWNASDSIAYADRNIGGLNYINGVLNTTIKCNDLTTRHLITLVNDIDIETNAKDPTFGKGNKEQPQVYDSSMKFYKFLGFKEVLSEKQIQMVIKRYNLNV